MAMGGVTANDAQTTDNFSYGTISHAKNQRHLKAVIMAVIGMQLVLSYFVRMLQGAMEVYVKEMVRSKPGHGWTVRVRISSTEDV